MPGLCQSNLSVGITVGHCMRTKGEDCGHVQSISDLPSFPSNYYLPFQGGRSGGSVVDNILVYQSRDRKIDFPLLRSFG